MFLNLAPLERKLRIVVGLVLIAAGFAASFPWQWHLAAMSIGVSAVLSASFGFCPLKAVLFGKFGQESA